MVVVRWQGERPSYCKLPQEPSLLVAKMIFSPMVLEVSAKFLKDKQNFGFDPSLRKNSLKSSLACHVSKPFLKRWVVLLRPP